MATRTLITTILRRAGGVALAACLPPLTLAQPINLQPPGPSSGVAALPLAAPAPTQAISLDAMRQAQAHLAAARVAYERGRTAEAEDKLERAETDLLNQPPSAADAHSTDTEHAITDIGTARRSLARRDRQDVLLAISDAMSAMNLAARVASPTPAALPATPAAAEVASSPAPMGTYALLPGHWALRGWKYAWVPPETIPRRAEYRPLVQGHYVWQNGEWQWVPAHYESN
jgi:hypothetical protein